MKGKKTRVGGGRGGRGVAFSTTFEGCNERAYNISPPENDDILTHPAAQPRCTLGRNAVESRRRAGGVTARREGPRGRVERPPRARRGVPIGPEEQDRFGGRGCDAVGWVGRFEQGRTGRVVVVGDVDHGGGTHRG